MTAKGKAAGNLRHRRGKSPTNQNTKTEDEPEQEPWLVEEPSHTDRDENDDIDEAEEDEQQQHDGYLLTPLIQRSIATRLDVGPFLVAYSLLMYADYHHDIAAQASTTTTLLLQPVTLAFATVLVTHLMLVLLQQWNIPIRALVGYQRGAQTLMRGGDESTDWAASLAIISSWTHCLVQEEAQAKASASAIPVAADQKKNEASSSSSAPKKNKGANSAAAAAGAAGIAPVETRTETNNAKVAIVQFHDITFRCPIVPKALDQDITLWRRRKQNDSSKNKTKEQQQQQPRAQLSFHRVRFPIHSPLSFYLHWSGHSSLESVRQCQRMYGTNAVVLQLPTFTDLLSEQVVAPFFLFQIFCVALWSLDEYWYYAIFTLFALLSFESTVAYNRLQSLQRLRSASHQNKQGIWVYRPGFAQTTKATAVKGNKSTAAVAVAATSSPWIRITAQEVVPGDIVSLSPELEASIPTTRGEASGNNKNTQHNTVPADVLVLQGSAVVDEALLTGESIPQLKVPLESTISATIAKERLDIQEHKESVLFGGTVLLTANTSTDFEGKPSDDTTTTTNNKKSSEEKNQMASPPDDGVVGVVLRTGFETAQGSLLRTIAHSSKSADGVHNQDTFVFIFMLLCCALASASMVLKDGWEDDTRNRFRLVLHVIIVLTSVIPPELPMELSLAVTNSVADLMKRCQVFCTEHHRIAWAGSVDTCCFDKTGTITSDQMRLKGVRLFEEGDLDALNEENALVSPADDDPDALPWSTMRVMAACHSLALNRSTGSSGSQIIGDPLEQAVLKDTGYQLVGNNMLIPHRPLPNRPKSITILHRFAFASRLKRMTTLVTEQNSADMASGTSGTVWALTKGAPETIRNLLNNLPSDYDEISTYHMSRGRRVLAMGYRSLGSGHTVRSLKDGGRVKIEKDLTFAGFLILDCPLKSDSKLVISELKKSDHNVVMVTGDAVLTAAEVARQVGIIPTRQDNSKHVTYWLQEGLISGNNKPIDPLSRFTFAQLSHKKTPGVETSLALVKNIQYLHSLVQSGSAAFCITGDMLTKVATAAFDSDGESNNGEGLAKLPSSATINEKSLLLHPRAQTVLQDLVSIVSIFARHAPHQKEAVVAAFNHSGHYTCMVGDGTNDVGALKRAHVGISIISAPGAEKKQLEANATLSKLKKERKAQKKGQKADTSSSRNRSMEESLRLLQEAQDEIDQVELGDASMASPFTSKQVSIMCCKNVLQQGRCTLVTMLQIYKILGINCLVNAMVLSTLFLHGVKQGDRQLTVLGMVVAGLFFFVTRGKPLPTLSRLRPPSSVLCPHALLSIALQFAIHCVMILVATNAALSFVDPYDPSIIPDGPFNPNVLNTCTFMLTVLATINTFAVNYRGRPFMEDLQENKLLMRSLLTCYGALFLCAYEAFPPLNDLLQLSSFPTTTLLANATVASVDDHWLASVVEDDTVLSRLVRTLDFPTFMTLLMVLDTVLSYCADKTILRIFEPQ